MYAGTEDQLLQYSLLLFNAGSEISAINDQYPGQYYYLSPTYNRDLSIHALVTLGPREVCALVYSSPFPEVYH